MRLNKKIMLSALSVVLLMAMAVTAITFSLADETDQGGATGDQVADAGDEVPVALTNIDYIIKNSNDESGDVDPFYRIVEIGSGDASPSLQAMVADGSFKDFVIDGNRTIEATMKSNDQVVYNYFKAADVDDTDADTLAIISQADFIYVSQDPNAKYSSDNDIKEEVYNILHTYAVGDYKPFVIDSPTATGVVIEDDDILTMSQVASDYFIPSGVYNYTYKWDPTWTLDYYLSGTIGTDSMYIAINGKERSAYWETVIAGETTAKMAKFLVVSASGAVMNSSSSYGYQMFNSANTAVANIYTDAEGNAIDNVYYCDGLLETKAYNMRYAIPDAIKVEETSVAALETADIDFADYDMVIIEDDCSAEVISEDLYSKFVAAMYGNVHITYGSGLASTSTSTGGSTGPTGSYNETNYAEIFYMVATDKEVERYQNIMVTNPTEFGIIATSKSAETCKTIADLINSSSYRGIGGPGSTSTMFTVLEIQPCYPIDTALAEKQKGYYTKPSDVLTGVSVDEIPVDTEYYAWELSKAKIADALGMDAGAINLVQMSTEEFAASKVDILGTYDLVYIGGNTSALKPLEEWASLLELKGYDNYIGYYENGALLNYQNQLPIYTMYAHAGDMVRINVAMTGASGGPVRGDGSGPLAKAVYDTSGSNTFGTLNGNDITYNGYLRLKAYIDAGMPLIVSDEVSAAVDVIRAQRDKSEGGEYLQNAIDPDCNVFKFLDYCKGLEEQTNICWAFDHDGVEVVKAEAEHGTTLNGQVHVFTDTVANEINTVYKDSTTRPKLAVTSMPATYNLYDETTKLEEKSLKYKFDVTGVSDDYTVNLYIDDDGNGLFEQSTGELLAYTNSKKPDFDNSLSFTVSDNFSGPLYWKLELVDNTTKSVVSTTSLSYIKASDSSKKQVSILQIVPGTERTSNTAADVLGEGPQGYNSLYFCTVCQQTYRQLIYNPLGNADRLSTGCLYGGNYDDQLLDSSGCYSGVYMGLHEHEFGIAKYDSNLPQSKDTTVLGRDDWDQNLADEVSDLYDFDLTIMYRSEFEEMSQKIADAYAGLTEEEIATKKEEYKAAADAYGSLYSENELLAAEKEAELREVITALVDTTANATLKSEYQRLLDTRHYWDFFTINTRAAIYDVNMGNVTVDGKDYSFRKAYAEYVKYNDLKITNKEFYKENMYYYYGSAWLHEAFSTIIIGPAEDFAGDDITNTNALADLVYYIEEHGQVLLFHDTLTRFDSAGTVHLTKTLRGYFGMDRYPMVLDDKNAGTGSDTYYLNYTVDPDVEANETDAKYKYFMMNLSYKDKSDATRFTSWYNDMNDIFFAATNNGLAQRYYTNIQYSDGLLMSMHTKANFINPYKYAMFSWSTAAAWANEANSTTVTGTNKASQNNKGIITLYPFTLSDQLNISGTHCQAYALDLESEDMTVWYSLAGGTSTDKTMSSVYAASPNDGMDEYFIYSYGNINYCGAGHSKVTGKLKDNNDERRLYINIICNSVRPSVKQPTIEVFDHGTKDKNEIIERDIVAGKGYIYEVDGEKIYDDPESTLAGKLQGEQGYPEFTFKVTVDSEATLEYVNIYYDLDFDETAEIPDNTFTANKDVMIAQWGKDTNKTVSAGVYTDVTMWDATLNRLATTAEDTYDYFLNETDNYVSFAPTALKLDPAKDGSYFAPYGGKYTYIVIEAIDSNGNKVYQRIKIQIKEHLFNLT